jgi:hypothetical protein
MSKIACAELLTSQANVPFQEQIVAAMTFHHPDERDRREVIMHAVSFLEKKLTVPVLALVALALE